MHSHFLSFPDKADDLGCSLGLSGAFDPLTGCLSDGCEDLVMPPSIPALAQRLVAAQDVFQRPYFGTQGACGCFFFAPCEEVGWAWEDIMDFLEQEPYSLAIATARCPSRWLFAPSPGPTSSRNPAYTEPLLRWFALPWLKLTHPPAPTSASLFCCCSRVRLLVGSQVQLCLAPLSQGSPCASAVTLAASSCATAT